jgi:hypothetical protein
MKVSEEGLTPITQTTRSNHHFFNVHRVPMTPDGWPLWHPTSRLQTIVLWSAVSFSVLVSFMTVSGDELITCFMEQLGHRSDEL